MSRGSKVFRIWLLAIYLLGIGLFCLFLARGADFYATAFADRPHHSDYGLYRPAGRIGLTFGLVGTVLMLLLLLYSVRRRTRLLGRKIPLKYWLDVHISFGVIGPLFILLHTSFRIGGLVSISFWSMVGVGLSGVLGRYLYVQIPRDLYGQELEVGSTSQLDQTMARHLDAFPELTADLRMSLLRLLHGRFDQSTRLSHMILGDIALLIRHLQVRRSLAPHFAKPRLQALIEGAWQIEAQRRSAIRLRALHKFLHLWHVIHRPFALIMYLIMLVHIVVALIFGISWR